MEAPDFWDDTEVSQAKMKELKSLKDDIETYHHLEGQYDDIETLLEMGYEENRRLTISVLRRFCLVNMMEKTPSFLFMQEPGERSLVTGTVCCIACTNAGQMIKALR